MPFRDYKRGVKIMVAWADRLLMILLLTGFFQACQRNEVANKTSDYRLNSDTEALKRSPEVLLVIPDGFSGVLRIVKDPRDGRQLTLQTNRVVIEFPENGTVLVKDFAALEKPHVLKARYSSGRVLKVDLDDKTALSAEKSLWPLGSVRGTKYPLETMIFLVCPGSERDALARGLR